MHRDIRANLGDYLRNFRALSALFPDDPALFRIGFKCYGFSIFTCDVYIDLTPNYYINSRFYYIVDRSLTIISDIFNDNGYYKSNNIVSYDYSEFTNYKKYKISNRGYINYKYDQIIILDLYDMISINFIDRYYSPDIHIAIKSAKQSYDKRYNYIMRRIKK
jgi:hypothetical protein